MLGINLTNKNKNKLVQPLTVDPLEFEEKEFDQSPQNLKKSQHE